ncbi:MAG: DNA polymerase/3'-5' exonuclease PolX [Proteobacteria bacterium]|nr:DNA polymerase/3'-5' exonuclease PolX [Pseudomonadota bacterium]
MLKIQGLGPKKTMRLYRELGVKSIDELETAIKMKRVQDLAGFGQLSAAKISNAIELLHKYRGRILLSLASHLAQSLTGHLAAVPGLKHLEFAGSFRRARETIGDLDVLASCENGAILMDQLANFDGVEQVEARGSTGMRVRLGTGFRIDLRVISDNSWGAAFIYFTGSKAHNIELRQRAQDLGLKLNEYGVFNGEQRIAGASEEEVYKALGLTWIPPEVREARGEIQQAALGCLPHLIEKESIRGDLHIHTTFSDGRDSLRSMVTEAVKRGYEYLALTDHSQRVRIAKGLDENTITSYWATIDSLQVEFPQIKLLKGIELDILEDGSLDLPDYILSKADWVIAALHYGQMQSSRSLTERLIQAVRHPSVRALAHPSGRLIGERQPYQADFANIFKIAAEYGCALEINGQPQRLDLNGELLQLARRYPSWFVINSDAHSLAEFDFLGFGLSQARGGSLDADHILNAQPWSMISQKAPWHSPGTPLRS